MIDKIQDKVDDVMASDFMSKLFRRRPLVTLGRHEGFAKTLTATTLVSLGIGSVVGAGIFVLTGQAAAKYAGPALSLSFVISAIACFFTGLCYAELASTIPIAGSAYTYVYVTSGEFAAWIVGLCLSLEYMFSASAVAVGWSGALQELFREFNVAVPAKLAHAPLAVVDDEIVITGAFFNLPAIIIIVVLSQILYIGVKESTRFNNAAVAVKVGVLTVFVAYGVYYGSVEWDKMKDNWTPFVPPNAGKFGKYGVSGVFRGAGAIFFAYVGFDCVCAAAQECKNPQRDVPIGLMGTLISCTVLFISVSLVLTGLMDYRLLNTDAPVIEALFHVNAHPFFRFLVEIGTMAGLTSVILVTLLSQPRILYAIANDGLIPKSIAEIHPVYQTPFRATTFTCIFCCCLAAIFPLDLLGELISFGTLLAFTMVCWGVIRLRKLYPDYPRPFSTPLVPYIPLAGMLTCIMQMLSLPPQTFRNCSVWLVLGTVYYAVYGRKHSNLARLNVDAVMGQPRNSSPEGEEMKEVQP